MLSTHYPTAPLSLSLPTTLQLPDAPYSVNFTIDTNASFNTLSIATLRSIRQHYLDHLGFDILPTAHSTTIPTMLLNGSQHAPSCLIFAFSSRWLPPSGTHKVPPTSAFVVTRHSTDVIAIIDSNWHSLQSIPQSLPPAQSHQLPQASLDAATVKYATICVNDQLLKFYGQISNELPTVARLDSSLRLNITYAGSAFHL
jgi:hypothetical protein